MSNIAEIYTDLDGDPLPADEAFALARHIAEQGDEAGFAPEVIEDARHRVLDVHPVFASFTPETRATIARNTVVVTVSTDRYVFSHGKQPRGTGDWAFLFNGNPSPIWLLSLSYAEAKAAAVARAEREGVTRIEVAP